MKLILVLFCVAAAQARVVFKDEESSTNQPEQYNPSNYNENQFTPSESLNQYNRNRENSDNQIVQTVQEEDEDFIERLKNLKDGETPSESDLQRLTQFLINEESQGRTFGHVKSSLHYLYSKFLAPLFQPIHIDAIGPPPAGLHGNNFGQYQSQPPQHHEGGYEQSQEYNGGYNQGGYNQGGYTIGYESPFSLLWNWKRGSQWKTDVNKKGEHVRIPIHRQIFDSAANFVGHHTKNLRNFLFPYSKE